MRSETMKGNKNAVSPDPPREQITVSHSKERRELYAIIASKMLGVPPGDVPREIIHNLMLKAYYRIIDTEAERLLAMLSVPDPGEEAKQEARQAYHASWIEMIRKGMEENSELSERERLLLTKRYGLGGEPPQKMKEIGAGLGLTRQGASFLLNKTLKKIVPADWTPYGSGDDPFEDLMDKPEKE